MRFFPCWCFALALSFAAAEAGVAAPTVAAPDAEARYQALLAAAKAAAPNADWAALRLAHSERPGFLAIAQSGARRQMLEAGADCKVALPSAKAAIAENYVDPDAHFVAAFCEDAAGDAVAASLDRDIGRGLISSIETGDGFSAATAFTSTAMSATKASRGEESGRGAFGGSSSSGISSPRRIGRRAMRLRSLRMPAFGSQEWLTKIPGGWVS